MNTPTIIQGGMGIGISDWRLAKAVASTGQLGVVSGTSLDNAFIRRLQDGDPEGCLRRALRHFPDPDIAQKIKRTFYIRGGKRADKPYRLAPMFSIKPSRDLLEITVAANFAEVFLAKEGHSGFVGINLLEKIQLPNLASLYGAMLAGVDYVLMGAGIPREIPGALRKLSRHQEAELKLTVEGESKDKDWRVRFHPDVIRKSNSATLMIPRFLPIVASTALARFMVRATNNQLEGLIIEGPSAGGHNAPPRGPHRINDKGEPIYGTKDAVDLDAIASMGLPFWLAGSWASPELFRKAISLGAQGVQIGTAFAFCEESGMRKDLKQAILKKALDGNIEIFTDPVASPTGFPFKVINLSSTLSQKDLYQTRRRICDLGYLRTAYQKPDGTLGYRCPSEPIKSFLQKQGKMKETVGRKCLCNALMANINLGQIRPWDYEELPLQTSGDSITETVRQFCHNGPSYFAKDVIELLTKKRDRNYTHPVNKMPYPAIPSFS